MKKTRRRDPLASNWRDEKYAEVSQTAEYYLYGRAVEVNTGIFSRKHQRGREAINERWTREVFNFRLDDDHVPLHADDADVDRYKGFYEERRTAIKYFYIAVFGAPNEDQWHDLKLIPAISHMLCIPVSSHSTVKRILLEIASKMEAYSSQHSRSGGRKAAIEHGSAQADIIYKSLLNNLTATETAHILNAYREANNQEVISRSAVQSFIYRSECIKTRKRQLKKSGRDDPECNWAVCRLAQASQWAEQFRIGKLPVDHPDVLQSPYPPLFEDGIAFWDEHHRQVILGNANVYQHLVSQDANGKFSSPANGGAFSPTSDITSVKYPGEGRGCFGVAIVTNIIGGSKSEGKRAAPFDYTGRTVVTDKAFKVAMEIETSRVLPLKGCWGSPGQGYKERYGEEHWEDEVRKTVNKSLCSIHSIIDHVISESIKLYAGTERALTFHIFHDGLTVWWTPEAQAYIASKGFGDRQMQCLGATNKGTRYEGKVVGDSPEFCRGLDAYGFSDFKRCTERMRALTSSYAFNDPRRFNFGTPSQVWDTMKRCWQLEPTSERIIADIMDFPRVLNIVIDHRGAVVPEINLRHGHRLAAINGGRVLKRKVTNRQRKHLLKMGPVHPDAQPALDRLLGRMPQSESPLAAAAASVTTPEPDEVMLTQEEIQEAEAEESAMMLQIENIVIEDDCEDSDEPELDVDEVEALINSGESFL